MSEIATADAFLFLVYFAIPSFIAIRVHDSFVPSDKREWGSMAVVLACYGFLIYSLYQMVRVILDLFWPAYFVPFPLFKISIDYRFIFVGCLLLPLVVGALHGIVPKVIASKLKKFSRGLILHSEPTAWDFVFAQRKPFYILFATKSGKLIGGYYGQKSFVTSYPQPSQIYLEEAWIPESTGWKQTVRTAGLLISLDECHYVEFFEAGPPGVPAQSHRRKVLWQKIKISSFARFLKSQRLQQIPSSNGKGEMAPSMTHQSASPQLGSDQPSQIPNSPARMEGNKQVKPVPQVQDLAAKPLLQTLQTPTPKSEEHEQTE